MASGYDGSIRIDTSISGKGFNAGIKSMIGSVNALAAAVGVAFSIAAAVNFGKESVKAASDMSSAWIGLKSVLDGTGKSFADGKKFISDYIKDGLVPATNAITAYKNLALRGYDDSQIQTVMTALKDSASFGRQSSLTLGYAVQSATEGLKNENSILVDNAGVTKNVSMMWKDYAASIGTTADKLTKQQKIQAEVAGIMEETRFQTGDAGKLAGTYAGQIAALGTSFYNLQVAVGNSIIPIISKVMPYIKAAVDQLVIFFNQVAQFMSLLFGVQIGGAVDAVDSLADSTNGAADAQNNLADSTKAAGKAAKGALAAFDELNVLQMDDGEKAGASTGDTKLPGIGSHATVTEENAAMDTMKQKVEEFKAAIAALVAPSLPALKHLGEAFSTLGKNIMDGLNWVWNNILKPFGEWVAKEVAPRFFEILADALDILNIVLEAIKPGLQWLWDNFLKPVAEFTGAAFIAFLDSVEADLDRLKEMFASGDFSALLIGDVETVRVGIVNILTKLWNWIVGLWGQLSTWWTLNVTAPLEIAFLAAWINISTWAGTTWENIKKVWNDAGKWFQDTVIDPLKDGFGKALGWLSDEWDKTFNGIEDFVKESINAIINFANRFLTNFSTGINNLINNLNSAMSYNPVWIPLKTTSPYQLPHLATGAVIPANAPFAAVLGDQKSGVNIESPVDVMAETFARVLAEQGGQKVTVDFGNSSLSALIRTLNPVIKQENDRVGSSFIKGATA